MPYWLPRNDMSARTMNRVLGSEEIICQAVRDELIELLLPTSLCLPIPLLEAIKLRFRAEPGLIGDWHVDLAGVEDPYVGLLTQAANNVRQRYRHPIWPSGLGEL